MAPALEALEAEGGIGHHPRQRLVVDRIAGGEPGAGRREPRREVGFADRPGRQVAEPGPRGEVHRVERQAPPAPQVGRAPELARDRDLWRVVCLRAQVLRHRQRLRVGSVPSPAALEHEHPPPAARQVEREHEPDRPGADHPDLGVEAGNRLEAQPVRNHQVPHPLLDATCSLRAGRRPSAGGWGPGPAAMLMTQRSPAFAQAGRPVRSHRPGARPQPGQTTQPTDNPSRLPKQAVLTHDSLSVFCSPASPNRPAENERQAKPSRLKL